MSIATTFDLAPDVDSRLIENGHFLFAKGDRFFRAKPPTQDVIDFFTKLLKGGVPGSETIVAADNNITMAVKFLADRTLLGTSLKREPTTLITGAGPYVTTSGDLAREISKSLAVLSERLPPRLTIAVSGEYDVVELGIMARKARAKGGTFIPVLLEHRCLRIGPIAAPGRWGCERCLYWRRVATARGAVKKLPALIARAPVLGAPIVQRLAPLVVETIETLLLKKGQVSWIAYDSPGIEVANFLPASDCRDCVEAMAEGNCRHERHT